MEKKISILGCGWLGLPLAIDLNQKGNIVKASNRSATKFDQLKKEAISTYLIDITKEKNDYSEFLDSEILIVPIPSKDLEGFKSLIEQIEQSNIQKVIFVSSTSVYSNSNSVVTEDHPTNDSALSLIEGLFRSNRNFKTTIIRFAGLIGYDRKPSLFFPEGRVIDQPEGFVNMIHRDDCIQIIEQVIEKDIWDETLNACADSHPSRRAYYTKEILKEGRSSPIFNEDSQNEYKIISNQKLKQVLSFEFKHPDLMA